MTDVGCADFEDAGRDWADMPYLEAMARIGDYFLRDPSPFVNIPGMLMMRTFNAVHANALQDVREILDALARGAGASALFLSWSIGAILRGLRAARWQVLPKILCIDAFAILLFLK